MTMMSFSGKPPLLVESFKTIPVAPQFFIDIFLIYPVLIKVFHLPITFAFPRAALHYSSEISMEQKDRQHYQKQETTINPLTKVDQLMLGIDDLVLVCSEFDFIEEELSISQVPIAQEDHHHWCILEQA